MKRRFYIELDEGYIPIFKACGITAPFSDFKEQILCKDCKFRNNDGECTQFDAYASAAGDAFSPHDQFHCGWAERKEE